MSPKKSKVPTAPVPAKRGYAKRKPIVRKPQTLDALHVAGALLQPDVVEAAIGFGRHYIMRRTAEGAFPKPIKIDGRNRWRSDDIRAWLAKQGTAAQGGAA